MRHWGLLGQGGEFFFSAEGVNIFCHLIPNKENILVTPQFDFGIDLSFKDQKSPTFVLHLEKEEKMPLRKVFGHPRPGRVRMLLIETSPLCDCISNSGSGRRPKPASDPSQL